MSVIQGPTSTSFQASETNTTSDNNQQAQAATTNSPVTAPQAAALSANSLLSSETIMRLTARNLSNPTAQAAESVLNTLSNHNPRAISQRASASIMDTADSDLFARLDTARQGNITKTDGKITRSDLRAAINNGGLSPEERAIAEYLLANFDSIASGRHIRADNLRAHAAGVALSGNANVPMAGLKSFMDDKEASSFFGFVRHDKDFRDLANGTSISRTELERGLNDNDFSPEQKQAIQFMLDNLDTIGGSDGRIQESELAGIVNTIERSQISHNMGQHRTHIKDFVLDDDLFQALSGSTSTRGTITKDELQQALASNYFNTQQKAAITFLLNNFDVITQGGDKISRNDLETLAMNDIAMLSKSLTDATQNYTQAASARSSIYDNRAQLETFVSKVDGLFKGDDQGHRVGPIALDRGQPGDEKFDNRTTFSEPFSLFSSQEAPTDGHVSRNDLERAINSSVLTADEKNLALVLLNNFTTVGNGLSTINADQIAAFLSTFSAQAATQSASQLQMTRI